ncbi:MAG: PorV/PorQ family protein [Bacteroidia bacterium]|nr:PorV/PorQ family protein [Bacteroidia bacterium]MCX7652645.1 PorV/PorQ family protein [Bacteroidia bacterium]MDW8417001.1 PorV/PorQ family protein [Bacteroidia bacterium]
MWRKLLVLSLPAAWSQILPNLGGQRMGISALTFLRIDPSPRAVGMAGAAVALKGDPFAAYWNAGALTHSPDISVGASHTFWIAGLDYSYLALSVPWRKSHRMGLQAQFLTSGPIERRTEYQSTGTGEYFTATYWAAGPVYAYEFSDRFSAGGSFKVVREQLDFFQATTWLVDLGFLYQTDVRDFRFGVSVLNFGPNSRLRVRRGKDEAAPDVSLSSYPAPTLFALGAAIKAFEKGAHRIDAALQLNHPNDYSENLRFGAEYAYAGVLFIRVGQKVGVKEQYIPTAGLGLARGFGRGRLRIDYAAEWIGRLGLQHRIGIVWQKEVSSSRSSS